MDMPRTSLASAIGEQHERIASYESGRVPLSFVVFLKIAEKWRLNPQWLAEGIGAECLSEDAFRSFGLEAISPKPRASFSQVYAEVLQPKARSREGRAMLAREWASEALETLVGELARGGLVERELLPGIMEKARALEETLSLAADHEAHRTLDTSRNAFTNETVQISTESRVAALLERVASLTRQRGARAALARHLGVKRQRLNEWLSGVAAPNGETSLRLLEWATAAEAQQKDAGRVAARPARKARVSKSSEEKSNPVPPRR